MRALLVGAFLAVLTSTANAQGWTTRDPEYVRQPGIIRNPLLRESSGVIRGRLTPSIFWTFNDSGNEPLLFAVDTLGVTKGVVRVLDAINIDWEAISGGSCGNNRWCLYVGDIGDNSAVRATIKIYRVVEPTLGDGTHEIVVRPLDSMFCSYPDGPHDAEALVVTARGDMVIITKGREGWVGAYWAPERFWRANSCTLLTLARLPIATSFLLGHLVSDAALSPAGDRLAVRTYREIYLFDRTPDTKIVPLHPRVTCPVSGLEPQGEGIAWWDDSTLIMTSERAHATSPITLLQCPLK